jgi:hypothetical protein
MVDFLKERGVDKLEHASLNESPDAIEMLGANPTKINWYNLSRNPSAMPIIENLDRYCWETSILPICPKRSAGRASAFNPNAMDILEKNKSGCKTVTSYLMSYNSEIFDEIKFKNVMMNDDEED